MAEFIRPAARALLRRWAETGAALALAGLGLWWGLTTPGFLGWLGWALAAVGVALAFSAVQRARFALPDEAQGAGPGLVELDEGEIRYFGPRGGGMVAIAEIDMLSISADAQFWLVETRRDDILVIPRAAAGAGALFDAFAALPGLDMAHLLRVVEAGPGPRARPIWRRAAQAILARPS